MFAAIWKAVDLAFLDIMKLRVFLILWEDKTLGKICCKTYLYVGSVLTSVDFQPKIRTSVHLSWCIPCLFIVPITATSIPNQGVSPEYMCACVCHRYVLLLRSSLWRSNHVLINQFLEEQSPQGTKIAKWDCALSPELSPADQRETLNVSLGSSFREVFSNPASSSLEFVYLFLTQNF